MRLLHYSVSEGGYVYDWPYHHIADELAREGHRVDFFNPVEKIGRTGTPADYAQALVDHLDDPAHAGAYDLFFGTITDERLTADAVQEVRRRGIAAVTLSTDDYSHPFRIRRIAASFDLVWSTVRETRHVLEGYGAKVIVMPFAANPHLLRPGNGPEQAHVGFVGLAYGARARHLASLAAAGLPVAVHGPAPDALYKDYGSTRTPLGRLGAGALHRAAESLRFAAGRACVAAALKRSAQDALRAPPERRFAHEITYLPGTSWHDLGAALSGSAVNLGSIELASTFVLRRPLLFIRLREFEAAMAGAVHLVNRSPELCAYFEEDREMLYFGSPEELEDKARHYLADARLSRRRSIRASARARALADHRWTNRFRALADRLGLPFGPD